MAATFECIPGQTAAELLRAEPAAVLFDVRDATATSTAPPTSAKTGFSAG